MALGSTQPLTEMSTSNLPGGKGRPARKADNLTAICMPIVWKMWEPRRLTTLWAFTACHRNSFTVTSCAFGSNFPSAHPVGATCKNIECPTLYPTSLQINMLESRNYATLCEFPTSNVTKACPPIGKIRNCSGNCDGNVPYGI
jgi:hypothetical protein